MTILRGFFSEWERQGRVHPWRLYLGVCALLLVLVEAACGASSRGARLPLAAAPSLPPGPKTVLVAGDDKLPVFNNAVAELRDRLATRGNVAAADMRLLSALPSGLAAPVAGTATLDHVLAAVAAMRPAPGQSCLVFATSHGGRHAGLWLAAGHTFLTPRALDAALQRGCGNAPTVVVISACFSGIFAQPPMTRANRIVLTAARPDRTSFGCGAGREFTVYDECLLTALDQAGTWKQVHGAIRQCVSEEERVLGAFPSEPQAWFAPSLGGMSAP